MGPADLAQVLRHLPLSAPNRDVLVGLDAPDDAGVYRLDGERALVQTLDFFTPVVDDPYAFGQVAAANALSDVYAMRGRPITALNIVAFPVAKLGPEVLAAILKGGADKVAEAGAVVIGGHSIDDPEPKFGLAVTGLVHPRRIGRKGGAKPGDRIVLTKPIGVGVVTTAIKKGLTAPEEEAEAVRVMATLNNVVDVLDEFDVAGLTDVTGFGLLGHLSEMARQAGVGVRLFASQVPVLEPALKYGREGAFPGGTRNNAAWLADKVDFAEDVDPVMRLLLCDAVTSGGLLIAVRTESVDGLLAALRARRALAAAVVAECVTAHPGRIAVER